ncbi:MAG TPA: hypothetical protein GXZ66_10970 [Clostridiaceae bacterium]|jgi:uncharacterized membrane protein|nr:hypothetical protein [Clostridiaceae bacterium]
MLFNILFWSSIIWVAPLVYYMLANETKFKKNIAVGVTIPLEGRSDEEVIKRLEKFKKELRFACIILVVVAIACLFVSDIYTTISLYGIWIVFCIILSYIPYVRCNKDLKEIKRKRNWQADTPKAITVTKLPEIKRFPLYTFIPAFLISIVPVFFDTTLFVVYLLNTISILLFWLLYRHAYENKPEMVNDNLELTKALTQVRKQNWSIMWLVSSYLMSFLSLVIFLTQNHPFPMLFSILLITAIFIIAIMRIEFKTRKIQEDLTKDTGQDLYIDEDDAWIGGIIYYNPNNKKLFVNYRVGTNVTVNVARPAGKVFLAITILLLIAIPFTGPILSQIGKAPIELYVKDNYITAKNGGTEYSIKLDNIESVELFEEKPDISRINGTGLENLAKGTFTLKGVGVIKVILDPNHTPFILVTTKDNKRYLFGSRDEEHTRNVYEEISKSLQASPNLQP